MQKRTDVLFLFDVDGTLSPSRNKASQETLNMLKKLRERVNIAFVGGSDLPKQKEQIGDNVLDLFDYSFPENGVQFYRGRELVSKNSFINYITEKEYQRLVNYIFVLFSKVTCPVKRGNFIELRSSMLNISPIGRSCSQEERIEFFKYDKEKKIRQAICDQISEEFKHANIKCSIGGQISIDIFPIGWDKTYCLNHIKEDKVVFFGDMTMEGGNDYEIYSHPRVDGNTVKDPTDTIKKVNLKLKELGIPEIN